jgi:hypothetical protein
MFLSKIINEALLRRAPSKLWNYSEALSLLLSATLWKTPLCENSLEALSVALCEPVGEFRPRPRKV